MPALTGLEPRTMVFSPGSPRQASSRATAPRRVGDDQALRRQVRELGPERWRVHLVLAELCERAVDLGEQLEPAEGATLAETAGALEPAVAASIHSTLWGSVSTRHLAATRLRLSRTVICATERGLAGMASVRLIWPNWPACETSARMHKGEERHAE